MAESVTRTAMGSPDATLSPQDAYRVGILARVSWMIVAFTSGMGFSCWAEEEHMTALVILGVYGVLGLDVAVHAFLQKRGASLGEAMGQAVLALVLWPFLLPVLFAQAGPSPQPVKAAQSARARRWMR